MPMPPPTRSGRGTSRRKPFPSGPRTPSSSPRSSAQRALVPGPIGSIKTPSSPGGARQRLIGRGRRRPGASSMKNWPGRPGSPPPRRTRSSVYGPTGSTPATLSGARLAGTDALLQGEGGLGPGVTDRVHGRGGAREGRDARDARDERGFADQVAGGAGIGSVRCVHDEIAAAPPHEVDDCAALLDRLDLEAGGGERARGAVGRDEREAEPGQRGRDRDEGRLVVVANGEERRTRGGQRPAGRALCLGERGRQVGGARPHLA